MKLAKLADSLWGRNAKLRYLYIITILLLFSFLGAKEIWTQEHRWADIVTGMFYRNDFLHPYLGEVPYYDKPLLSYWFIALFAFIFKGLNTWALRLPSVIAGVLAVWSIQSIGTSIKDRKLGMIAAWMLATTFYFVFWARVASADMLNVAGTLFAIAWYLSRKDKADFYDYCAFFVIIAITSLCKGLVGAIIPLLAVFIDMCIHGTIRRHLNIKMLLALIPAIVVYLIPFMLSAYFSDPNFGDDGLYLVYKENILRYFQPFDHKGPIYTYIVYLPIYALPWTLFFIPALFALPHRWSRLSKNVKWLAWTLFVIFLFFTFSGSRRSYYVLPIVPFAILLAAEWVRVAKSSESLRQRLAAICVWISVLLIFVAMDVLPAYFYERCGINRFAIRLQYEAEKIQPWGVWKVVMLDAESKLSFYLGLPPTTKNYDVRGNRYHQISRNLQKRWQLASIRNPNTIIVSRKAYEPILDTSFAGYKKLKMSIGQCIPFTKDTEEDMPIAYIPLR